MEKDQPCGVTYDLISLARLCQIIGDPECRELRILTQNSPEVSLHRHLVDSGRVPERYLPSLELAQALIEKGVIKEPQFCVAMFDEITSGIPMKNSLIVRGWLPSGWTGDVI
jgi:hypothetical protein